MSQRKNLWRKGSYKSYQNSYIQCGGIGGKLPVVSVKTASDIPKNKIKECAAGLKNITVQAPVKIGDIVLENIGGTGIALIATKNVERR